MGQSPTLHWNANPEPDLDHYNIYRKVGSGNWNLLNTTTNTQYTDYTVVRRWRTYPEICYKISAEDWADQESNKTSQDCIWGELLQKISSLPQEYALHKNIPNPFNPVTRIRYDLPENSYVKFRIFDIMGREIRTLLNEDIEAGYRSVIWNGMDSYGNPVSSGMYIYHIYARSREGNDGFSETRKMVLLR